MSSESSREKKFTPGPWEALACGDVMTSTREAFMSPGVSSEDINANANLIAAAPELLELAELSCKTCYAKKKLYDAMNGCNKAKDDCHACSFYYAIKKAYGETP